MYQFEPSLYRNTVSQKCFRRNTVLKMSHQEIPIAVAEIVGISKGDKTSYDRELDQRIASVILELQKKSEQVEGIETEIRTLKTSLEPLLGCTFMRRFILLSSITFLFMYYFSCMNILI